MTTSTLLPKIKEGFAGQQSCILPQAKRNFCSSNQLCSNLYLTDIGYYPHAAFHNRERPQGCQQHILIYCVKGEGWYKIANKYYTVKANQYFILPGKQSHEYGADEKNPWSIYWVHYCGKDAEYMNRFLSASGGPPVAVDPSPLRIMIFEDILHHLGFMNNSENIVYANASLHAFLISFKQVQLKDANTKKNPIQEVIDLMKNNLDKNFSLDQLANAVNISSSHLSALFRKKTKYSPVNLFTSLKVQKASQLLMDSHHSIKTIAYSLGYDDQYHFSRVFKKTMGVSPKKFKDKIKKEQRIRN